MDDETRYRVTDKKEYVDFDGVVVETGKLVPKDVEVPAAVVKAGWVKEE